MQKTSMKKRKKIMVLLKHKKTLHRKRKAQASLEYLLMFALMIIIVLYVTHALKKIIDKAKEIGNLITKIEDAM